MVIDAAIEANLLGMRLLTLKAAITVLPAKTTDRHLVTDAHVATRPLNGRPGKVLAEAARSLQAGAAELATAKQRMPGGVGHLPESRTSRVVK